jgi:hypothetical protein
LLEFLQPEQLKAAGLVSNDYINNKKYPIKTVYQIIRLKTADGREWLLSRQMWTGLDRLGNELPQAMDDKESWWKPVFIYEQMRLDPKDPLGKMQKRTSVNSVSMVLRVNDPSVLPRGIIKYSDFRDREFDELMEWATTPKFNLDRSVKDQLSERQYG